MRRLRLAEWGVFVGATGLLVTLFLDWYDVVVPSTGVESADRVIAQAVGEISTTGWSSLGWFALLLLTICIACGLLLWGLILADAGDVFTLPPGVGLAMLGIPALVVLLIVVALQPNLGAGAPNDAVELTAVGWAGIACTVLLVVCGLLSIHDERTTGSDRVYAPPPPRPAPPPG